MSTQAAAPRRLTRVAAHIAQTSTLERSCRCSGATKLYLVTRQQPPLPTAKAAPYTQVLSARRTHRLHRIARHPAGRGNRRHPGPPDSHNLGREGLIQSASHEGVGEGHLVAQVVHLVCTHHIAVEPQHVRKVGKQSNEGAITLTHGDTNELLKSWPNPAIAPATVGWVELRREFRWRLGLKQV